MFLRTYRSIETETDGRSLLVPWLVAGLLCAWGVWFFAVPVTLYESTTSARLEVVRATTPVEAQVPGRIVAMPTLKLGHLAKGNEVVVRLDAQAEELAVAETRAREASLSAQIEANREEMRLHEQTLLAEQRRTKYVRAEMRSRHREGVVAARLARSEAARARELLGKRAAAQAAADKLFAEAEWRHADELALAAQVHRSRSDAVIHEQERRTRIGALQSELARLMGQIAIERSRLATALYEVERRVIRVAAAGRLSEVADVHVGSVLRAGDRVATVIADDSLRLVADFAPTSVFGHVRTGQTARVRFEGFPWVEYGVVNASVQHVAGEVRGGRARVELAVEAASALRIPMQHGLSATVAIAVDRITPAQLVLRTIGKRVASPLDRSR